MTADAAGSRYPAESLVVLGGRPLGPQDPVTVGGYRIHALLGVGGMGRVYLGRAQHPGHGAERSGAWVAVKVIRPDLADNPEFRRRFARELEAVGLVRTPYAAGLVHGEPEARQPWMATEFVPGVALADAVRAGEPLPAHSVWRLAHDLGSALSAVHRAGIVHRDVKPSNVILGSGGAKIIDFGVAHASELSQLTATGANIGTPSYMAPEQAKAGEVSPASDMFSLGVLLYFAASGRLPFGEGGTAEVLFRVVYEEPDLSGLDRVEPTLRDLILRCMTKAPLGRPNAAGVVVMAENAAATGLWNAHEAAAWPEALAVRISERTHAAARTLLDPSLFDLPLFDPPPLESLLYANVPEPAAAAGASSSYGAYQPSEPPGLPLPPPLPPPPVDRMPTRYAVPGDSGAGNEAPKRRGVLLASVSVVAVLILGVVVYAVTSPGSHNSADTSPGASALPRDAAAGATGSAASPGVSSGASAGSGSTAGAAGVAASSTPDHQSSTASTGIVTILDVNSGLCLGVTGASTAAGATADLYTCNGSASENWTMNSSGVITGNDSGLCLSVSGDSTTPKSTADIDTCDGDSFEKWAVGSNGTLINGDGQCLSVTGASTSNYATADLYTCNGSVSESWTSR